MYAIKIGCQFLTDSDSIFPRFVKILSDSQAAILALKSSKITSSLVLDALCALEMVASQTKKLTLAWVRAHVGTPGNELADTAAKAGADDNTMLVHNTIHLYPKFSAGI